MASWGRQNIKPSTLSEAAEVMPACGGPVSGCKLEPGERWYFLASAHAHREAAHAHPSQLGSQGPEEDDSTRASKFSVN